MTAKKDKGLRKTEFDTTKPVQLQMLMTPSEIKSSINHSIDGPLGRNGDNSIWDEKRDDNESQRDLRGNASLLHRVAKNGVSVPVILHHDQFGYKRGGSTRIGMGNGHHRVEAAEQVHEESGGAEPHVPVIHDESFMGDSPDMSRAFPRAYRSGAEWGG